MKKMKIRPTKTFSYKRKEILVFDNLFEKKFVKEFSDFLMHKMPYKKRPSFDKESSAGLTKSIIEKIPSIYPAIEAIISRHNKKQPKSKKQSISFGYTAMVGSKSNTRIHKDIDCKCCITFLYYGNPEWDANWGGETLFYDDEKKDSIFSVTPKPGRLVMFSSSIFHATGVPKSGCPVNRYALSVFCHCKKMGPKSPVSDVRKIAGSN